MLKRTPKRSATSKLFVHTRTLPCPRIGFSSGPMTRTPDTRDSSTAEVPSVALGAVVTPVRGLSRPYDGGRCTRERDDACYPLHPFLRPDIVCPQTVSCCSCLMLGVYFPIEWGITLINTGSFAGHIRPLGNLAIRIVKECPLFIAFLVEPTFFERVETELGRNIEPTAEHLRQFIRHNSPNVTKNRRRTTYQVFSVWARTQASVSPKCSNHRSATPSSFTEDNLEVCF